MRRLTAFFLFLQILVFSLVPAFVSADAFPSPDCESLSTTDLDELMTYEIESRLDGLTASNSTKQIFSTRGNGTNPWVRNPDVWTSQGEPIDLTGVSPWNTGGYLKGGVLITPRHILFAHHFVIPNGAEVIFITEDNQIISRTVVAQEDIDNLDTQIALLNEDVPESLAFYPIMTLPQELKYLSDGHPAIAVFDQEEKVSVHDRTEYYSDEDYRIFFGEPPATTTRHAFYEELVGGDSGKPAFFIVDGQPVLAFAVTYFTFGDHLGAIINNINTAIEGLGDDGGYEISTIDLTCFDYVNHAPEFSSPSFTYSLSEEASNGMSVGTPDAEDEDLFSTITYSILSGNASSTFDIDEETGEISVADKDLIDYTVIPSYTLVIQAEDDDPTPLSATTSVTINITESRPTVRFSSTESSVTESGGTVDVRIRLNRVYTKDVSVVLTSADGSALADSDYTTASTTITVPEGDQFVDVTIAITNDDEEESSEAFTLNLSSPTKATLGAFTTHTVTIIDNDTEGEADEDSGGGGGGGGGGSSGRGGGGGSTPSVKELEARIVQLKAVLTALLSGKPAPEFSPSRATSLGAVAFSASDGSFTRDLELGAVGEDVRSLQEFLNDQGYFITTAGPGSHGNESTYFGPATQAALARFQADHAIVPAAGRFGPTTRGSVIALCSPPTTTNRFSCL